MRKNRAAAIYCRISKDTEGLGLGVERQEAECRALADARGLDVVEVYVDNDISAFRGKARPGFDRMVEDMKAGRFGVVLAWHPDRLTRQPTELETLIDLLDATGVPVVTVAAGEYDLATSAGRLSARIVGAVARAESETKSERLRSKMDQLADSGAAPGGRPPYGYRRAGKSYEVNDAEAAVVRRIVVDVNSGRSLLSIARALNAEGVATREGRPWHHATVRAVITNPAIAGRRVHRQKAAGGRENAVVGVGNWTPILDAATFDETVASLTDPARKRRQPVHAYLLTGLMFSPAGDRLIGRRDKDRRTYVTAGPRVGERLGPWVGIDAEAVEDLVVEAMLQRFDDVALPAPEVDETEAATVAEVEAELAEWSAMRGRNEITLAEWKAGHGPMVARLEAAKAAAGRRPARPVVAEPGELRASWPGLSFAEKRRVVEATVDRITVAPAGGRGRWAKAVDRVNVDFA